jgi:hypothetical protein
MTRVAALAAACVVAAGSVAAEAYLKLGNEVGDRTIPLKWSDLPVRYAVTDREVPGVSAVDLQAAVARAFETWAAVPDVGLAASFIGFTNSQPFAEDDVSVIGFRPRPDLERTLGATTFNVDTITGRVLEADIFFNSAFDWSIASGGQPGRWDVESIAVHEVGHLLGLGHSALGETELLSSGRRRVLAKSSVMFPIAYPAGNVADRSLTADDAAGLFDTYAPAAGRTLGAVRGRVTMAGQGVFGAHVTAFNPSTGDLVATFTLSSSGDFVIAGLPPGLYVVRAEPLDDADLDGFFDEGIDVNLDFRPAFAPSLAAVSAGGSSERIVIEVTPK